MLALYGSPESTRYLYGEPMNRPGARRWLEQRTVLPAFDGDDQWLGLAGVQRDSGQVVASFSFHLVSRPYGQGEVGFVVRPEAQGRGLATEGARALVDLGFDLLGLHRIFGRCDARNHASAAVLQRLGMRPEAHLRENEFVKGEWCDELIFAVLASEWPPGRSGARPPA